MKSSVLKDLSALRMISGPIPAGSPSVSAIIGVFLIYRRKHTMKKGGQEVHAHLRTARRNQIQNVGNVV